MTRDLKSLAAAADFDRIHGAYIFPPFGKYEAILQVLSDSGVRPA